MSVILPVTPCVHCTLDCTVNLCTKPKLNLKYFYTDMLTQLHGKHSYFMDQNLQQCLGEYEAQASHVCPDFVCCSHTIYNYVVKRLKLLVLDKYAKFKVHMFKLFYCITMLGQSP